METNDPDNHSHDNNNNNNDTNDATTTTTTTPQQERQQEQEQQDDDDHDNDNDVTDAIVTDLRQRGNYEFSKQNYDHALALYNSALDILMTTTTTTSTTTTTTTTTTTGAAPDQQQQQQEHQNDQQLQLQLLLYCNRSATYQQMEEYEMAIQDAMYAWDTLSHQTFIPAALRLANAVLASAAATTTTTITTTTRTRSDSPPPSPLSMDDDEHDNEHDNHKHDSSSSYSTSSSLSAIQKIDWALTTLRTARIRFFDSDNNDNNKNDKNQNDKNDNDKNTTTTTTNPMTTKDSTRTTTTTKKDEKEEREKQRRAIHQMIQHAEELQRNYLSKEFQNNNSKNEKDEDTTTHNNNNNNNDKNNKTKENSIKFVSRPVSIREFTKRNSHDSVLGVGNFSEICQVTCIATQEQFALKIIDKKRAADLAKRQHPNVYNEISMERRVLLERLRDDNDDDMFQNYCPYVIQCYHAFQDYTCLYYLSDLHTVWPDLWTMLREHPYDTTSYDSSSSSDDHHHDDDDDDDVDNDGSGGHGHGRRRHRGAGVMVGCHRTSARVWLYQLIAAMEFIHQHGIVHRDLKPENILLNEKGHVIVIDFGTAKDVLCTDLNGPDFVGTPDFMPPEAVQGTSSIEDANKAMAMGNMGSTFPVDLWALGAVAYILHTGTTPFWSASPYLAMLRIARAHVHRPTGIDDDATWDFISSLLKKDPYERAGAEAYRVAVSPEAKFGKKVIRHLPGGYDCLRQHAYFDPIRDAGVDPVTQKLRVDIETPVPSLLDWCLRAVVAMIEHDVSTNLELDEMHPPGDNSKHDLLRLDEQDRNAILHILDRRKKLQNPRIYDRFFKDLVSRRLNRVRPATHDFVGLTARNDDQGKLPKALMNDPYAEPVAVDPVRIVQITNPLLIEAINRACQTDSTKDIRKRYIKQFKRCIAGINTTRPKLVVVAGYVDDSCRKLLARISDSIPVVVHDGTTYFDFWYTGVQFLALSSALELTARTTTTTTTTTRGHRSDSKKKVVVADGPQLVWLRENVEQARMSKHVIFAFTEDDPRTWSARTQKVVARGRTLCLFGLPSASSSSSPVSPDVLPNDFEEKLVYHANDKVSIHSGNGNEHENDTEDDEVMSIKSTDSDEDKRDSFSTICTGTCQNGLRWITVLAPDNAKDYSIRFEAMDL